MSRVTLGLGIALLFTPQLLVANPPKLLSTSPAFWATNVNYATQKTISLTFDQPLRARFTDWVGWDVLSPPSSLETTFSEDKKSCSISVRLEPGRVYICGLNERGLPGVGFQNEKGLALPPTYLVFQTAGTPTPDNAPPAVVRVVPENGTQIDPAKSASISVMFDRAMNIKKHGLLLFENEKPVDLTKAQFAYSIDGRTFTLSYRFKPNAHYRLELNNTTNIGFSSARRVPLWPVAASFSTTP